LYLDLSKCQRCRQTDEILDEVIAELRPQLQKVKHLTINKIKMLDEKDQKKHGFKRSPTIRINGKDIEEIVSGKLKITDNYCSACSDVCSEDTDCRTFEYKGAVSENVPKEMLKEALQIVLSEDNSCGCGCE